MGGLAFAGGAKANESYQTGAEVQFTFAPEMSVALKDATCTNSLTDAAFEIDSLSPGNSGDSDAICISVSTNSASGYQILGSVGTSSNATTALEHSNGSSSLSSVATSYNSSTLTAGTWGYTTSTNNGTSYGNYSGLPAYTAVDAGKAIRTNDSGVVGTENTLMKIGAYATTGQVAGDYTNTINLYIVPYSAS